MIPLTLEEIARAVGGTVPRATDPGLTVTGPVVIDSREVTAGDLFAAIVEARTDGHDFARAAYAAGAGAVLGSRPVDGPCVVADDVVTALTKLAVLVRSRVSPVVIGLTGSVGTTTEDLLAQILEAEGPTVATSRSFNNEMGLPLTVLAADPQTRYLIVEMGAAQQGDITHLVRIARPQVGLVLNVGPAHVLTLGGIEGIAKAKAELVRSLPAAAQGGLALLNANDERVAAMARQTPAAVMFYGTSQDAAVRALDVTVDPTGHASFTLHTPAAEAPVRLGLPGENQVANALAAACAAIAVGVPTDRIAAALSRAVPRSPSRFQAEDRPGCAETPASTFAGVATRSAFAPTRRLRRRPGRSRAIGSWAGFSWPDGGKSGGDQGAAELGEHVREGRLGLGVVPRLGQSAGGDVVGAVAVLAVPDDHHGLDEHRERDCPLDRAS